MVRRDDAPTFDDGESFAEVAEGAQERESLVAIALEPVQQAIVFAADELVACSDKADGGKRRNFDYRVIRPRDRHIHTVSTTTAAVNTRGRRRLTPERGRVSSVVAAASRESVRPTAIRQ